MLGAKQNKTQTVHIECAHLNIVFRTDYNRQTGAAANENNNNNLTVYCICGQESASVSRALCSVQIKLHQKLSK